MKLKELARGFSSHYDMEMSSLPVNGCKFLPMLDTDCHLQMQLAVRVLQRATLTVTRGIHLKWSSPRTRDTHMRLLRIVQLWSCHNLFSRLRPVGFEHLILRMRDEQFNRLRHCCACHVFMTCPKISFFHKILPRDHEVFCNQVV